MLARRRSFAAARNLRLDRAGHGSRVDPRVSAAAAEGHHLVMSEFDITDLVLAEHEAFRRAFADLRQADNLLAGWQQLADRLEVHAAGEEEIFYPMLARAAEDGADDGVTAVREHNDIRHAVADVSGRELGSSDWWEAVQRVQEVNAEHMAEEERDFLPEFRDGVPAERRTELGLHWLKFHDDHERAEGLSHEDADPQTVVAAQPPAPIEQ